MRIFSILDVCYICRSDLHVYYMHAIYINNSQTSLGVGSQEHMLDVQELYPASFLTSEAFITQVSIAAM